MIDKTLDKILEVKDLKVYYTHKTSWFKPSQVVRAVDGISFDVFTGETLAIVGESGSGKSSLARSLVGLNKVTSGEIVFLGKEHLQNADKDAWHRLHRQIQFIFQNPIASLNPRMTVLQIIAEPLRIYEPRLNDQEVRQRVLELINLVGLADNYLNRRPLELSGGQCQRVAIARALILNPQLLVCDEAVSALDVSVKAQIINLLKDLQLRLNLTIIFISHDLSIVKYLCDRVLVMYKGKIMELAARDVFYDNCQHPYSQELLSSVLIPDPKIRIASFKSS